jgi:hypothetical protein
MQLELWERETLSAKELSTVAREVRNLYWFIRTTRRGLHDARRRRVYRKISVHKKRLLEAGVSKREILDLLACCRSKRCLGKRCLDCADRAAELDYKI